LLFILNTFLLFHKINEKSPVIDEGVYSAIGWVYLKKGETRFITGHPLLGKIILALPLILLNPELPEKIDSYIYKKFPREVALPKTFKFRTNFLYIWNKNILDKLIFLSRFVNILFTLILNFIIFSFALKTYGPNSSIFTLLLLSTSPVYISNARLGTLDLTATFFIILFLFQFLKILKKYNLKNFLILTLLFFISINIRFNSLILTPLYLYVILKTITKRKISEVILNILLMYILFILLYKDFPFPENYIKNILWQFFHQQQGHLLYFMGNTYLHIPFTYLPFAFLVKTTIPNIILFLFTLISVFIVKLDKNEKIIFYFMSFYFLFSIFFNKLGLGIRYILPVYPLIFLLSSRILKIKKIKYIALISIFNLYEIINISPHYLEYINQTIGGPQKGWLYIGDSNIDWAQDRKLLKKYIKEKKLTEIKGLRYGSWKFAYDINYEELKWQDLYNPYGKVIIISLEKFQKIIIPWWNTLDKKSRKKFLWLFHPDEKVAYTLFIYDFREKGRTFKK